MAVTAPSAKGDLRRDLDEVGLAALADWAWEQYLNGASIAQIMLDARDQPAYKTRFAGLDELRKKGRAVSEATWINAEKAYASQMRAFGLPESFYDGPEDFAKLIVGEVSPQEFGDRLEMVSQVVAADPRGQTLRNELGSLYGFSNADGLALAYWIDPDRGADIIKKQFTAATSSAASVKAGFGSLTRDEAERVGSGRYTEDFLLGAFGKADQMGEFLTGPDAVTRDDLIAGTVEGNADAQEKIGKTAKRRVGEFQQGGGYASGQTGISGLGSASS